MLQSMSWLESWRLGIRILLKFSSTMKPTVETRPSRNLPSMTTAKEKRHLKDSKTNLKDTFYLLHPLIPSMSNGLQSSKLLMEKRRKSWTQLSI